MLKISTRSQYGLLAMAYLARNNKKVLSLQKISEAEGIPFDYLEKIISQLKKKNLVKSKKGFSGGYFLTKNPSKIKVGEIIRTLDEEIALVKCLKDSCPKEKDCLTKNFWEKLNENINLTLDSISLAELIKN